MKASIARTIAINSPLKFEVRGFARLIVRSRRQTTKLEKKKINKTDSGGQEMCEEHLHRQTRRGTEFGLWSQMKRNSHSCLVLRYRECAFVLRELETGRVRGLPTDTHNRTDTTGEDHVGGTTTGVSPFGTLNRSIPDESIGEQGRC